MIEKLAEEDEAIFEKYVEGAAIGEEELRRAIRRATVAIKITPVLCGSAFKYKGVQRLLDAVVDYLPSPVDVPCRAGGGARRHGAALIREASDDTPFSALVFKNPDRSVYRAVGLHPGLFGYVPGRRERLQRGQGAQGTHRPPAAHACQQTRRRARGAERRKFSASWGSGQSRPATPFATKSIRLSSRKSIFRTPVLSLAIEPKTKADQQKIGMALAKLSKEDPTFTVHTDRETNQTVLSGDGRVAPWRFSLTA